MDPLSDTLKQITTALENLGIRYAIGGSLASSARSVWRSTLDVDLVAAMLPAQAEAFVGALGKDWYADLVVFDPDTDDAGDIVLRRDLPGGCGRLYADSEGIAHVFVNGRRIVADGETTGELPGTVGSDQPEVRLVNQGGGLECVTGRLRRHPCGREAAQLVVHERQEFRGGLTIPGRGRV